MSGLYSDSARKADSQNTSHLTEDELMELVNCTDPAVLSEDETIRRRLEHIASCDMCYSLFTAMSSLSLALDGSEPSTLSLENAADLFHAKAASKESQEELSDPDSELQELI